MKRRHKTDSQRLAQIERIQSKFERSPHRTTLPKVDVPKVQAPNDDDSLMSHAIGCLILAGIVAAIFLGYQFMALAWPLSLLLIIVGVVFAVFYWEGYELLYPLVFSVFIGLLIVCLAQVFLNVQGSSVGTKDVHQVETWLLWIWWQTKSALGISLPTLCFILLGLLLAGYTFQRIKQPVAIFRKGRDFLGHGLIVLTTVCSFTFLASPSLEELRERDHQRMVSHYEEQMKRYVANIRQELKAVSIILACEQIEIELNNLDEQETDNLRDVLSNVDKVIKKTAAVPPHSYIEKDFFFDQRELPKDFIARPHPRKLTSTPLVFQQAIPSFSESEIRESFRLEELKPIDAKELSYRFIRSLASVLSPAARAGNALTGQAQSVLLEKLDHSLREFSERPQTLAERTKRQDLLQAHERILTDLNKREQAAKNQAQEIKVATKTLFGEVVGSFLPSGSQPLVDMFINNIITGAAEAVLEKALRNTPQIKPLGIDSLLDQLVRAKSAFPQDRLLIFDLKTARLPHSSEAESNYQTLIEKLAKQEAQKIVRLEILENERKEAARLEMEKIEAVRLERLARKRKLLLLEAKSMGISVKELIRLKSHSLPQPYQPPPRRVKTGPKGGKGCTCGCSDYL